ncbi:hypothetical protein MIND_00872100 [Mycena indigotica]|uniref:HNH nuclease domain-containing protein n=1 Tax=Mycena indigotica TaxID=2126181 RepID=A0A8H6VYW1_9AGAR|nr:uncharacterized protein MIND_00872100 [Mycena indigotica]KAF7299234.1 hypothetical protein MIND_00872100 [Mycena indigotica]
MHDLPKVADLPQDFTATAIRNWEFILEAEALAKASHRRNEPKSGDRLVATRVVGFFLLDLWTHQQRPCYLTAYSSFYNEITSCRAEAQLERAYEKLWELGLLYRNHLFRVSPTESEHPSRSSFERMRQDLMAAMRNAPVTNVDARKQALFRDGYACTLTGIFNLSSIPKIQWLGPHIMAVGGQTGLVQCAHIFSESAQESTQTQDKTNYAASALAILEKFGMNSEMLLGTNVHRTFNTISMSAALHGLFDTLHFWFEEDVNAEPNTYNVVTMDPYPIAFLPARVTFTVDPHALADCATQGIPVPSLPSPTLLAIHAACCRVAHLSGAAEQADQILHDLETTQVLAEDGGSSHLLMSRLLQVVA